MNIAKDIENHINKISKEFRDGFEFLEKYPKSVTIFGSSKLTSASSHYNDAYKLAQRIVKETKYSIITGGGAGIMEAANKGTKDANGESLGLNIVLPIEQKINEYTTNHIRFDYFFIRKALMAFASECYIFFPGGFGTFDELFEVLTLLQTKKIPRVPVILFGKDFWNPVRNLIQKHMLEIHHTIDPEDINLFVITDSIEQTIKIIKEAPVSEWWKEFD